MRAPSMYAVFTIRCIPDVNPEVGLSSAIHLDIGPKEGQVLQLISDKPIS